MTTKVTELANHYLGNVLNDPVLKDRVHQALHNHHCLEVILDSEDRRKGRIHAQAISGESLGIIKDRSWALAEGDVLQTNADQLLLVHLKDQGMIVLTFTGNTSGHELALVHLGHTLGNHHHPISIRDEKIYISVGGNRQTIESTINSFKIPGLMVSYEQCSPGSVTFSHSSHHHHDV